MNSVIEAMVRTDEPSQESGVDFSQIKTIMRQIHDRFVDERVQGFKHHETGEDIPPVSREEAEARWEQVMPLYARTILGSRNDPDSLRLGAQDKPGAAGVPGATDYYGSEEQAAAMKPERGPDWRTKNKLPPSMYKRALSGRGRTESVADVVKKLIRG